MRKANIVSRINTDVTLISSLIAGISKGEIKVPKFQRKFVWKDDQALNLLDSIASNYPIGSLLLWRTKEKLRAERNIGEFGLPSTDDMDPTEYVLDGQQRLTVIYSCLGASQNDGGFKAVFDLETGNFVRQPESLKQFQFPLRKIFNTTDLLNFRASIQNLPAGAKYQESLDALIGSFVDYRIPVVTLKDLTVQEVCPIFERINSSGTRLSTYDLMVAATWNNDFDLNDEVDQIRDALASKGFEDIDRETVLKCLSAVHLGTIKEQSLMTLRSLGREEIKLLIERTKVALLMTVDLLSTEFKIYSWDFLSYEAIAVILCFIYSKTNSLSPDQVKRVRQWFWRSSFGERYKVGGEGFVSNDLRLVNEYIVNKAGTPEIFGAPPNEAEWQAIPFRSNVSRSRAFVLALAAAHPFNLIGGLRIDPAVALSAYNKKQFHHIYPRAHLRRTNEEINDNLLLNICMLSAHANNAISDGDPKHYLPDVANSHDADANSVFLSNLMPPPSEFDYGGASYGTFLIARAKVVAEFVDSLCAGNPLPYDGRISLTVQRRLF